MYQTRILKLVPLYDPRQIEAMMRVEYGTLDHLTADRFAHEVEIARQCVDEAGPDMAERIAKSFGL